MAVTASAGIMVATATWYNQSLYSQADGYLGKEITQIDFTGNVHVSKNDLYDIIQMRPGKILSADMLNSDLKAIYNQGSFSYAEARGRDYKDGVAILFAVVERPKIDEIEFLGLSEINEQEILDSILVKEDDVYTSRKVAQSVEIILAKYRELGLFNAVVKTRKSEVNKEDNTIILTFIIDEGEDMKVAKINLIGVRALDPEDLLSVLELEEDGFIADGTFKEELFEKDKNTIIEYYKSKGYLDAELEEARWDLRWKNPTLQEERVIIVTYRVKEGEQYFFNGYDLEWDGRFLNPTTNEPMFTRDKVYKFFEYTNDDIGDVFDFGKFSRDRGIINYLYSQEGYIFARVIPERTTIELTEEGIAEKENSQIQIAMAKDGVDYYNLEELKELLQDEPELKGRKFVHTRFVIAEGDKGFIENIIIKGNKKTLDKVIRRELLVNEGELFNAALVQRSRERVYNLGFFKEVNVDARPGSIEGKMNLIVDVQEQPTGTISLGGGYGTQTGFSIFTEISENNLNGTGQRISGRVEFGPQRTAVEASWTEPWIFDKPWSLTLSGFYSHREILAPALEISNQEENATYDKDSVGMSVGLGHRFWINWGHYHRVSTEFSRASNPSSMVDDSVYLQVIQGWQLQNTLTNGLYYDNRDNIFNTTTGLRADFSVDIVGNFMGGSDHYNRYEPKVSYYWWLFDYTFFNLIRKNVLRRWRVVFEHRASFAFTHETEPLYGTQDKTENAFIEPEDRLYLGGYESLRGWNLFDIYYPSAWRDGGSHRVLFGTELRVPVEPSLFWLVLFFDAGALYDNKNEYIIDETTSQETITNLENAALTKEHINLGYFRYSWGFGFRLQIPILPLRLYLAKRMIWDDNLGWFRTHPQSQGFEFVFGIGDRRF